MDKGEWKKLQFAIFFVISIYIGLVVDRREWGKHNEYYQLLLF